MKHLLAGTVCLMLVTSPEAEASNQGNARKSSTDTAAPRVAVPRGDRTSAPAPTPAPTTVTATVTKQAVFTTEEVRTIRAHYAPRQSALPRGLQKKYARTGQLPPGWQKKMEPFPVVLERSMPPLPAPYRRGIIDGHAVIYNSGAGTIVDVAVLF